MEPEAQGSVSDSINVLDCTMRRIVPIVRRHSEESDDTSQTMGSALSKGYYMELYVMATSVVVLL